MKVEATILGPDPQTLSRDLAEILAYWESKRGDRFAPPWGDFRLDELKPKILSLCVVVDVMSDPLDFIYRFWGTKRTHLQGHDYTGHSVREVKPMEIGEKIYRELAEVVANKEPIHIVTEGITSYGDPLRYDYLRLPLSSDNQTVDKIFSVGLDDESLKALHREFGTGSELFPGTR